MCCILSDSVKNLKVLTLKHLKVSQARIVLGRSFYFFAAAYLRLSSLPSLRALRQSSDLNVK